MRLFRSTRLAKVFILCWVLIAIVSKLILVFMIGLSSRESIEVLVVMLSFIWVLFDLVYAYILNEKNDDNKPNKTNNKIETKTKQKSNYFHIFKGTNH